MLLASVDIGTNAVRLLFATVHHRDGVIGIEKDTLLRIPVRLGKDVYSTGKISSARSRALVQTLKAFQMLMEVHKPESFKACATAAMREAVNGKQILKKIKKETGISVEVINGIEEARIIRSVTPVPIQNKHKKTLYIDVGGGSTEISVVEKNGDITVNSFPVGTLRILGGKVDDVEWKVLNNWLNQFNDSFGHIQMIASGGNSNKLLSLYGRSEENIIISTNLEYAFRQLSSLSVEERMEAFNLRPDRADVILPATQIYLTVMQKIGADSMLVPKMGLADGIIMQMYKEKMNV
ncbi:MAG: exopolyphosphatase [Bacteroidia bacterium]|nr:Ppx/GppA family phosphatase [Bacteroidales bacterium]MDD3960753.1 Ppx/GppA family phosphatase [Bacteroidales bacterium]MDY0286776.1 Ppx/GppA family phosphatase [Bacteroidales bacterium]NCD43128.1 exopolyphosphatase [Bacteroidia bacterium]HPE86309.1 Ppx/GppA family phosphatase [Bacteroidales bacterium]